MSQNQSYTIAFLLEQTLGHRTHSQNLQANVVQDRTVRPLWGLIDWELTGLARHLPVYRSNWTVRAGWRARQTMRRLQRASAVDALFIHTQVPAVLMTDWLRRVPTVVSLDATPQQYDTLGAHYAHAQGAPWLERLKWQANHRCFHQAQQLVAWSAWTKAGLVEEYGVPADKVTVIPPGVNSREWTRSTPRRLPTTATDPVKILFVGGDLQRKGGDLLLAAFRALSDQQSGVDKSATPTVELHLVTRDPVAAEPGLFVYYDMQPNSAPLKALFHSADIFCLPTRGDCLPMVLSEAGAAGLPLVATQVGGIGEIVKDGETGFLLPTDDCTALTTALRTLVENPALRLRQGEQAAALVQREFDAERNTERLLTLLKQVVTERNNRRAPNAPRQPQLRNQATVR